MMSIREHINQEIEAAGGKINFARFMELALYAPGLGYYNASSEQIGQTGDFITAPEISPLFAQCLAKQCQQVLTQIGPADILEFGAGNGTMAATILQTLAQLDCLPQHYFILELSANLRQRQKQTLSEICPEYLARVVWLDRLPSTDFKGVILANEVLDAMPVHRFRIDTDIIQEYFVALDQDQFIWQLAEASNPNLIEQIIAIKEHIAETTPYDSEINLALPAFINSLSDILAQGLILLIDYGFPGREYYHPQRHMGTLMCHYQHRTNHDPLQRVGEQDITAHVDFTAVAEAADAQNLHVAGYTQQAAFLLSCGILDMVANNVDNAAAVKRLTSPQEMGELFKVMALTRDLDLPLLGFNLLDKRGNLI